MKLSDGREMTECELRLGAAAIIKERGWCQGGYSNGTGAVCIVGALSVVLVGSTEGLGRVPDDSCEHLLFVRAVKAMGLVSPPLWNDYPGRTVHQVLAKLRDGCVAETAELESATP